MIEQSTKVLFFSFRVPYLKNDRWILRDGECAGFRYSNQNIRTKDRNGDDLNMFHIRDSDTSLPFHKLSNFIDKVFKPIIVFFLYILCIVEDERQPFWTENFVLLMALYLTSSTRKTSPRFEFSDKSCHPILFRIKWGGGM